LHINSSTLEIVRVRSSSPVATTFPLPICHTTTIMTTEALRPRNLNVNHQQKTFPSRRNGCIRLDALRQSRQRHPGGGLLRTWCQCDASRCISPFDRRFAVSLILNKHTCVVANCDHTSESVHWVHAYIGIAMGDAANISPHIPSTLSFRSVGR
jgi:hypothetical protein